jgi:O-methyltransferase
MLRSIKATVGSLLSRTPLRHGVCYEYSYSLSPAELAFLVESLTRTKDIPGDIFEIGCFRGHTTCFLNRHLQMSGIEKDYYCVDTFSGFARDDIDFERSRRRKKGHDYTGFGANSLKWFERTLALNRCKRVFCVQTDVKKYQFLRPVSVALLDVDLYQPTLYSLQNLWPALSPGGVIAVHDCQADSVFDGSLQAYTEFTESQHLPRSFGPGKFGLIFKN